MDLIVVLVVFAAVAWIVSAPLRGQRAQAADAGESAERADLEARKELKYREIRDAELDHRTGKLSEQDWRELDRRLRAEAIELLREADQLDGPGGPSADDRLP